MVADENVAVVLSALAAWNAGDMNRLGDVCDPAAVVHAPPNWPEPGPFIGREAIMRQFAQLRETFDSDSMEQLSEFETAGDRVLVRVALDATGHGPAMHFEWTLLYTVRRGLISGLEYFPDHGDALRAAGLTG